MPQPAEAGGGILCRKWRGCKRAGGSCLGLNMRKRRPGSFSLPLLQDECLNETLFTSLAHARAVLEAWRNDYNRLKPHSALGNQPAADYAALGAPVT